MDETLHEEALRWVEGGGPSDAYADHDVACMWSGLVQKLMRRNTDWVVKGMPVEVVARELYKKTGEWNSLRACEYMARIVVDLYIDTLEGS